ncbi:cupin domain-containing protein [Cognatishimia sp. MH4019]|uniref:cupin domain-containing protein n=1 Tax=Cognatishimia sp. MH4019 TaxID=2854030 RepID=UPI001CD33C14|nr:cupin domain-containing protein [Cognatishimia sp. MH4019]
MPIIKLADAPIEEMTPETADALGPYCAHLLSDAGGLTQFGAFVEVLAPGSRSSDKHYHMTQDEFVYVLDGTVTLHEGDSTTDMSAGDAATFKAGAPVGHCFENRSDGPVSYLVVGTRSGDDVVHYTERDKVLTVKDGVRYVTDRKGNPIPE